MVEGDYVTALLFAVISLEGVHSVLLQISLDRRFTASITDDNARAKQVENTANRLLEEMGISELLEITPLLFLDVEDRPSDDQLRNCKLGVTIRNEIMHAKVKKGQYKLRNRSNEQISEAYSSVLEVFNLFVKIVERDTETDNTN
jgi:uncharacterized protein YeeX (DUF496 family)